MGISFSAMTRGDFYDLGGEVRSPLTRDSSASLQKGLDSTDVFGYPAGRKEYLKSMQRYNRRAYISLCKPVFNYVLAGSSCSLLAKVLGISENDMKAITSYSVAWSSELEELVPIDELEDDEPLLCGAEMIERAIELFDVEAEIIKEFHLGILCESVIRPGTEMEEIGTIDKQREEDGIQLCAGYFLHPSEEIGKCIKRGRDLSEITDFIKYKYFKNDETRLSYLINMPSIDSLYGMIQDMITVLPPGMRPSVQNRRDMLTKAYVKILRANQELALAIDGGMSREEVRMRYKALDNAVSSFQYLSDPNDIRTKSVLEKLKTKHGQIRALNLGKRQDYSGRTAVIINPFLPLDKVRIPRKILPKIFRLHMMPYIEDRQLLRMLSQASDKECLEIIEQQDLLSKVPMIVGRQPTLHKLGILALWVEMTDANAIEMNPLVVVGYNMDFDGDTAWAAVPLSKEAIEEAKNLMSSVQNLYVPKTGECIICPRQDMLYGLYMCTQNGYTLGTPVGQYANYATAREAVIDHKIKVYDTITVAGKAEIAGYAAFKSCFPRTMKVEVKQINSKTIKEYVNLLLNKSVSIFAQTINSLVELGFKVAKTYSPSMSLLTQEEECEPYDTAFDHFHVAMEEEDKLYDLGFEDNSTYNMEFDSQFKEVEDIMAKNVVNKLGTSNGYWLFADSGARGNVSNLLQMFGYKGRIAKSTTESFNAVIEDCYVTQLNSLDHFITAYGGRKGQMDKSLKTGDTGYAMRQMWHSTATCVIEKDDCGTTEGIMVQKSDIAQFCDDEQEINEIFYMMIKGRYQTTNNLYITSEMAKQYTEQLNKIEIRSPLTCKCNCCRKCYGDDLSTNEDAVVGLPAGFIAAHSIGEPATQLVMKQFQKGGVAGRGDVMSNFDRLEKYVHCSNLYKAFKDGTYATYDPLAWEDGEVTETPKGNKFKRVTIGDNKKKYIMLPRGAVVKKEVKRGEGLCVKRGDHDINEMINYSGIKAAQIYLTHMLYTIYKSECKINMKHFEVLVASMTRHMVIDAGLSNLKVGQYYTTKEIENYADNDTVYVSRLLSLRSLPLVSQQALANIVFENVGAGLAKAVFLQRTDDLEDPLSRMCMGLTPKAGTYYPDFMMQRKRR